MQRARPPCPCWYTGASIFVCLASWTLAACSVEPGESQQEQRAGSFSGSSTEYQPLADCGELLHFRLIGLKDLYRADLCVGDLGAVSGNFYVFAEYSEFPTATGAFTGRLDGTELALQFASGKPPYPQSPDETPQHVVRWHLDAEPTAARKLVFEIYGRDHDRNLWRTYLAEMERARLVTGASLAKITAGDLEAAAAP
jgi:hypothetical protein